MSTFGFIIAACLRNEDHVNALKGCIDSIQTLYESQKIVVIIDFSSVIGFVLPLINSYKNVLFEIDTPHVPADMLLLHYFKEKHYFDVAITLQDSMRVKKKFNVPLDDNVNYLWYFTNHRIHWSIIGEPQTDFNIKNGIKTHDDLNHYIIDNWLDEPDFKSYCVETYDIKEQWSGCFGCCCVISYDFLIKMNNKTKIIDSMMKMTSNRLRRSIESIFSLACQFTKQCEIHSAIDGLYTDGYSGHGLNGEYIYKVSFDRQ